MKEAWIWVSRWEDFQHYAPERDRAPAWIKTYPKQLDDDRYTDLPPRARALLHDVRMAFARCAYRVRTTHGTLAHRVAQRVYTSDLKLLVDAGFIEIISRETLERRLELLYTSRAPARSREEDLEEELEEPPHRGGGSSSRSDETDAAAPALNGRAALDTPDNDDIPIAPRSTPTFPCSECAQTFDDWDARLTHLALDHPRPLEAK